MSEKDNEFEKEIQRLEASVNHIEQVLDEIKKTIVYLKSIAWDKVSKKESSSMYKVLQDEKSHTNIKSNIGDILVDKEFMEKEIQKHLDDPKLRGMITTQEMLSFPKVAKNIEPEFNPQQQGYTWQAKANDENILSYEEREYNDRHRLLIAHSKTERGGRGHSHRQINDPDFHNSVSDESISQNQSNDDILEQDSKTQDFTNKPKVCKRK